MRNADIVTLLRLLLLLPVAYLIMARANALAVLPLIALLFLLDWVDGYVASMEKTKPPKYAAYVDIWADRIVEYVFWLLFTLLQLLPWYVLGIVFVRNTVADVLVYRKGKTFKKMKSSFGRIASSHISRGAYAAIKAINFMYLALVAVAGWPLSIGYLLTGIVVVYSLLRGSAEVYEALS